MRGGVVKVPVSRDGDAGHPGDDGVDEPPRGGQSDEALDGQPQDPRLARVGVWVVV